MPVRRITSTPSGRHGRDRPGFRPDRETPPIASAGYVEPRRMSYSSALVDQINRFDREAVIRPAKEYKF
jgi:hypothetical protein